MDQTTWILVADASEAKIFSTFKALLLNGHANSSSLTLVNEFSHPESQKKDQDLVSDKSGNFSGNSFTEPTDPKRHENDLFAHELTKVLLQAHNNNHFRDLILIAPPAFMGMLHKHLSDQVKKLICNEIEKDYTHCNTKELIARIQEHL